MDMYYKLTLHYAINLYDLHTYIVSVSRKRCQQKGQRDGGCRYVRTQECTRLIHVVRAREGAYFVDRGNRKRLRAPEWNAARRCRE